MRLLNINELEEGMILGEDIVGHYGIMFLTKGTILTEQYIRGLKRLNLEYIYVLEKLMEGDSHEDSESAIAVANMKLNKEYYKTLDIFKSTYKNIVMNNEIEIENIQKAVSPILDEIISNPNILGRLRQINIEDEYIYLHSIDVCMLSVMIGKWLGFSLEILNNLAISALLHDIGKSKVPSEILYKPGKLTEDEFEIIKKHTIFGYEMVKDMPDIHNDIAYGILQHHERIDGKGYPNGLKGDEIHIFGRIIAIADIFDAMTSERVYSKKESAFKVAELLGNNRFDILDPHICGVFLDNISKFYVGNIVRLNSGEIGEVVMIHKHIPTRPLVKVGDKFIDLSQRYEFEITETIG